MYYIFYLQLYHYFQILFISSQDNRFSSLVAVAHVSLTNHYQSVSKTIPKKIWQNRQRGVSESCMISGLFLGIFWPSAKFETRPYPAKTNNNSKRYIIAAIQFFKNFFLYISHKNWSWKLLAVIFGQQPAKHNIFARRLGRHVQGALGSWFTWLLELEVTCIDLGDVWFRSHFAKLKFGSHSLIGMCFLPPFGLHV
jgi:hypothetical protein